ncbi:MAG: D-alanyl-D-alanine carboxypeptidase family protein [Nitrospiraceae bacterium]
MASLRELHRDLIPSARYLYAIGKYYDPLLVVTSSFRSSSKQARLYRAWLTGESKIPAAPPGRSLHGYGLAFDLARIGKDPFNDPLLNWLGGLWESWGGQYGGSRDPVHFQVRM